MSQIKEGWVVTILQENEVDIIKVFLNAEKLAKCIMGFDNAKIEIKRCELESEE